MPRSKVTGGALEGTGGAPTECGRGTGLEFLGDDADHRRQQQESAGLSLAPLRLEAPPLGLAQKPGLDQAGDVAQEESARPLSEWSAGAGEARQRHEIEQAASGRGDHSRQAAAPVSYTHLTLPTKRIV